MHTYKRYRMPLLILLLSFTLVLNACQTITIENRTACFVNGELSLGSTCANTVGTSVTSELDTETTIQMLEAKPAIGISPARPPAVFQSAADYGEETTELEVACRLLGSSCSYALKSTVANHKMILKKLDSLVPK